MEPKIERICEDVVFGEGPHWDISRQCLYFVDVVSKTINRYVPATNSVYKAYFDTYPSFIIPVEGEKMKFVLGFEKNISVVMWDGEKYRLNDGKCDASGRLWTGSTVHKLAGVAEKLGSIFSLAKDMAKDHGGEVTCSNGLAWSKDNKVFFHVDSLKKIVERFDFDIATGNITNRTVFFSYDKHNLEGYPDGMVIDEDENLWIASFLGNKIIKINSKEPETLLTTIELPAKQVTSMAWGGKNLDELYVTTGRNAFQGDGLEPPIHGSIYKISGLGTKGYPMVNFRMA
ncbi:hypothetical protein HHI36_002984 [Cryptolaemus montrouzieri]|uniref:Regucalcin n=1 Tax=Cryptolaemus montrouzieri TaxID=559131 RepID=A0ABD2PDL6_9CUCU